MPELNPNLILAGSQNSYAPLNDLTSIYQNAQKFRAGQVEIDDATQKQQQSQAINNAYKAATGSDGKVNPSVLQASLASGGAGSAIPLYQKGQADLAHTQAQTAQAGATTDATMQETLHKGLTMIDGSIASLAARPDVNENMVVGEVGRLVNAGAFDVQARHAGTTPDEYAKNMLSTMPVGNPDALKPWLVQAGLRTADAATRLKSTLPQYNEQDRGGVINEGTVDPLTGQRTDGANVAKTNTPGELLSAQTQRRGQDITAATAKAQLEAKDGADEVSPDAEKSMAEMIAARQMPPLSAYASSKPSGLRIMALVHQMDPNFNSGDVATQTATMKNFAQGPLGNKVRSVNVAIDHMSTFMDMAKALDSGNAPAYNSLKNTFSQQLGGVDVTNLEAVKHILSKEAVSMIVAGGGSDREREEMEKSLASANSLKQLAGVISTYHRLGVGQLNGLQQQYESGTGRQDFDSHLSPSVRAIRARVTGSAPVAGGTVAPSGVPATAPSPGQPAQPANGGLSLDHFYK